MSTEPRLTSNNYIIETMVKTTDTSHMLPAKIGVAEGLSALSDAMKSHPKIKTGELIKGEFDYEAFCRRIDNDVGINAALTNTQIRAVKTIFNPATSAIDAAKLVKQYMIFKYNAFSLKHSEYIESGDVCDAWKNTWQKVIDHHKTDIEFYHETMIELTEKRRRKKNAGLTVLDLNSEPAIDLSYPGRPPKIRLFHTPLPFAAMWLGKGNDEAELYISEWFLKLPKEKQEAVMLHEAHHAMEAVLENKHPKEYSKYRALQNEQLGNIPARRHEKQGDALAATLGDGYAFGESLKDFEIKGIKFWNEHKNIHTYIISHVLCHAHDCGLKMEPVRDAEFENPPNKEARAALYLRDRFNHMTSEYVFGNEPKPRNIRPRNQTHANHNRPVVSVHPPTEERIMETARIEWKKRAKRNMENPGACME